MKKKYLVEFTYASGEKDKIELITDNIEWSITQFCRNRAVSSHKIINEGASNGKQMLFG
jgi:hypothetical protein